MQSGPYYDVAVAGAGPAGCAAARLLAQSGLRVALLEKAALPRYKACGGGLTGRALQLLGPIPAQAVQRSLPALCLALPGAGLEFTAACPAPGMHMVIRGDLDHELSRKAIAAGADLLERHPVRAVALREDGLEIRAGKALIRAGFLVAADGSCGPTARLAGWPGSPHLRPALEYELEVCARDFQRHSASARFDLGCVRGGYGWVFPKRSHLSVGLVCMKSGAPDLRQALRDYLRRLGLEGAEALEEHCWPLPIAPRHRILARQRVLLAGDAAGLVDPVTGEGIYHALLSGQLAAQAIRDGGADAAGVAARYHGLLARQVLPELRAGRWLAGLLYGHPRLQDWIFGHHGRALVDFMVRVVTGQASYRAALRRPSSYLKLLSKA